MMSLVQTLHQSEDALRASLIQISGRFVGQKQGRMIYQSPRNRYTLLFATGKLAGVFVRVIRQPDFAQPALRRTERLARSLAPN